MTVMDILIVLSVFAGFAYLIFAKLHANNPELIDKIKGWMEKKEEKSVPTQDQYQQVWNEKREII